MLVVFLYLYLPFCLRHLQIKSTNQLQTISWLQHNAVLLKMGAWPFARRHFDWLLELKAWYNWQVVVVIACRFGTLRDRSDSGVLPMHTTEMHMVFLTPSFDHSHFFQFSASFIAFFQYAKFNWINILIQIIICSELEWIENSRTDIIPTNRCMIM